ncbi:RNA polymerase factor sigma-54 [Oceanobacillus halotolerans]|uniref:RNA polymerase factor sigma-54 n=1 Tax=Oceanobacillus halotolerans TaxID=2663380 RepID=UPI0013DC55A9|nr:RNA polymerase factor sigma-54 [Oceanobacillus halotolerans]
MRPKLAQEQTLQRKMNQSLIQAIHLLQFSSVELIEYVKEVAKDNPLIEDIHVGDGFENYKVNRVEDVNIGEINAATETMYDQLKHQVYMLDVEREMRSLILFGVDSLDDDGYLDITLEMWAHLCHTSIPQVEKALTMLQSLDPAGIGARNLAECILLQLNETQVNKNILSDMLQYHLAWIAEEDISAMVDHYSLTESEAVEMITHIKSCHPKPGQFLTDKEPSYIVPEAKIDEENGKCKILFYKWNSPSIELNKDYLTLRTDDQETTTYLKEKSKQVEWLKHAIHYRSHSLELVIQTIVEKQNLFFLHGPFMIKPLTLKEIAQELHLHVSTVSRTIQHKYVQTKHGIFPLNFFLQSGIKQKDGKTTAAFVIKQLIVELVQHEDQTKPFSDESLKQRLSKEFGIKIARRTVMKYREQLRIPASTKRKRGKHTNG